MPSEKLPVATRLAVVPRAIDGFVGVTAIERKVALVTTMIADALIGPTAAVTVLVPAPTPLILPGAVAPVPTVATSDALEDHAAVPVRSAVVPSVYVPVTVSWLDVVLARVTDAGATLSDLSVAAVTVTVALASRPSKLAVTIAEPIATPVLTAYCRRAACRRETGKPSASLGCRQ